MSRISPETCIPTEVLGAFSEGIQAALGGAGDGAWERQMTFDAHTVRPLFPEDPSDPEWVDPDNQEKTIRTLTTIGSASLHAGMWRDGTVVRAARLVSMDKPNKANKPSVYVEVGQLPDGTYISLTVNVGLWNGKTFRSYGGTPYFRRLPDGLNTKVRLIDALEDGKEITLPSIRQFGGALAVVGAVSDTLGFPVPETPVDSPDNGVAQ